MHKRHLAIALGTTALALLAFSCHKTQPAATSTNSSTNMAADTTQTNPPAAPAVKRTPADQASYQKAVSTYQYRFQLDNCHGTPGSISLKSGVKFMVENKDDAAHKIAVAGQTFQTKAFGFFVTSVTKAGTYPITCDGGGAAQLIVEK